MANFVENKIYLKGTEESLLEFVNTGLKNCDIEPQTDIKTAVHMLKEKGYARIGQTNGTPNMNLTTVYFPHFSTFRPVPETFLLYDTTNYKKDIPEIAQEQMEKYGAIGWFDFFREKWFGTKWDCELTNIRVKKCEKEFVLSFETSTAWTIPSHWLNWINETFPNIHLYDFAVEESLDFAYFHDFNNPKLGIDYINWFENVENQKEYKAVYKDALKDAEKVVFGTEDKNEKKIRIAILDHDEEALYIEDIRESVLARYQNDIDDYIDAFYDMESYSWEEIKTIKHLDDGEINVVNI